ncbi:MAG: biotin--[acetyl-CoA-carboxylase] ligase [Burkholderiales bacterium]
MKPLTFSVLRLLSDEEFHSGEEMARLLDVSRTGIWQALQDLDESGLSLQRIRGRGYRLPQGIQWLNRERILSAIGANANRIDLMLADSVESTNSMLLQNTALGAPHGACLASELQTRGRGRRGRSWHTGLGGGLAFSLLWRFNQGVASLSGLSLAAGVAVARALREAGVSDVSLKWPNDVLHRHHKLAGILIELQGDMLGPSAAVIGIGLNLKLSDRTRSAIDQAVTDVHSVCKTPPDRNLLQGRLLAHLIEVLDLFSESGFSALREEWRQLHAYHGKTVRLLQPNGPVIEGRIVDVSDDGSLLLDSGSGPRHIASGEISLRGAA